MADLGSKRQLDPTLQELVRTRLGSRCKVLDLSRSSGRRSTTWKLTAVDGTNFYLKRHEHPSHYRAEVLALTEWVPLLAVSDWWSAPTVISRHDEQGAVIISEVPGTVFSEIETTPAERAAVFRLAGQLAALIHRLKVDPYKAGSARTYDSHTIRIFREFAAPYLDSEVLNWFESVCKSDEVFAGLALLPTHSDYSPRNWVIDRSANGLRLGLIDWERARPGYWLEDAQRMVADDWFREPGMESAFYQGYDQSPDRREEHQIKLIALINAVGAVPWAIEHGDAEFAEFGRRSIAWLRSELS